MAAGSYTTVDGDRLDTIVYQQYGTVDGGVLETVLAANFGLADLGPLYGPGLTIILPDIVQGTTTSQGVRLWD